MNQKIFLGGLSSGTTARSTRNSQLMSSMYKSYGQEILPEQVLRYMS